MSGKKTEPKCLREGKAFHKKVQAEWRTHAEGEVQIEKTVRKKDRTGRLDVFVSDTGSEVRAIVEIKHSDWDKMTPQAVRRNVKRQARQVWKYIELQPTLDGICPGIVFPKRPSDPQRLELISSVCLKKKASRSFGKTNPQQNERRGRCPAPQTIRGLIRDGSFRTATYNWGR